MKGRPPCGSNASVSHKTTPLALYDALASPPDNVAAQHEAT